MGQIPRTMQSEWPLASRAYWNYLSESNKAIFPGSVSPMRKRRFLPHGPKILGSRRKEKRGRDIVFVTFLKGS